MWYLQGPAGTATGLCRCVSSAFSSIQRRRFAMQEQPRRSVGALLILLQQDPPLPGPLAPSHRPPLDLDLPISLRPPRPPFCRQHSGAPLRCPPPLHPGPQLPHLAPPPTQLASPYSRPSLPPGRRDHRAPNCCRGDRHFCSSPIVVGPPDLRPSRRGRGYRLRPLRTLV
jgi:hypothetical protein